MRSIRSRYLLPTLVLLLPLVVACERRPEAPAVDEGVPAELTAAAERYVAAWNGDDPSAVAAFYPTDATATLADTTWQGPAEIEARWVRMNQPGISNLRVIESSWQKMNGDWREQGRYSLMFTPPEGEPAEAPGSYSHDWMLDAGGEWHIRSSDVRPDAPPES